MKKFIVISAILIFALTNYAYGLGSGSRHRHGNSGTSGVTVQDFNTAEDGDTEIVSVPEPSTLLLLGAGLIGLGAYAWRKFRK